MKIDLNTSLKNNIHENSLTKMNYKLSFKLTSDNTQKSIIPNIYHLTNDLQKLLKEYHGSNLKIEGYNFEHEEFTPYYSEDFQEVKK